MTDQRFIIEMGSGTVLHSMDYTKAASRAIDDALHHSCIPMLNAMEIDADDMRVQVTIGVQDPDEVDCTALARQLPRGRAEVKAVFGGLNVVNPDTGSTVVVATAAVEAFLPPMAGRL